MDKKLFEQDHRRPVQTNIPTTEAVQVQIEDDRTGMTVETLKRAFADNLYYIQGKNESLATPYDYYMALAYTLRDRLLHRWINTTSTYIEKDVKSVYYLSAEFLMGCQLTNNLLNLGLYERVRQAIHESGLNLNDLIRPQDAARWNLTTAADINDSGQILGTGYTPEGRLIMYLATPVPEAGTWAMLLLGSGMVVLTVRRRHRAAMSRRYATSCARSS